MIRFSLAVCMVLLALVGVLPVMAGHDDPDSSLRTADIRTALLYGMSSSVQAERRSVPLAMGLSAVLPGAGQAYNRNWIKAAVAIALEGALVGAYFSWRSRGLDGEEAYKEYAHDFWNPGRYASWVNDYVVYLNEVHGASITAEPIDVPGGIDFSSPENWTGQDRAAVRQFFDRIRAVEGELFHPETGATFSHKLPYFSEQQYYELIGKYFLFAPGWEDYPAWRVGDEFTQAIDPVASGPDGKKLSVHGRFFEYAEDHADANTLLRNASRISS
ncbi:MAG: DUF5683 domain-containing protein, partial [Rhodothermales bacterium]